MVYFGFARREDQHLRFGNSVDQRNARVRAQRFGQIVARLHVVEIAVDEIFAVRGQVADLGSLHEFVDARNRRRLQVVELGARRQKLEQGHARIGRRLLGRRRAQVRSLRHKVSSVNTARNRGTLKLHRI